jgi:hypothetical protein
VDIFLLEERGAPSTTMNEKIKLLDEIQGELLKCPSRADGDKVEERLIALGDAWAILRRLKLRESHAGSGSRVIN